MIMLLEMTCRDSLVPLLDPGYDSVGTEVKAKLSTSTTAG
jgi:predicted thioesterase